MNEFTCNLHQHTDFSIHDGFAIVSDLVTRAKELGYTSLAITDHGTMTGCISFYEECKKQGIKPILGCEFYFTNNIESKEEKTYHLLLLAKDYAGYQNLMRLDTYAYEHFYRKPRIDIGGLIKYHDGLICTTACIAGPLSNHDNRDLILELKSLFKDDFYIELQPHDFDEQYEYNKKWSSGEYDDVKRIITLDSHYVSKEDTKYHRLWLGLGEEDEYYQSGDYYLMGTEEIYDKLSYLPKEIIDVSIQSVHEIEQKCNVEIPTGGQHYPVFCDDPEAYVREKMNQGWREKGISSLPNKQRYLEQAKYELEVLKKVNYFNYFCIVDDMIRWCRENDIPTGLGRGSVGGCLVAYLMGITKVDPIKYNLIFERFANPERVTSADVDTDISQEKRPLLLQYIQSKYGQAYPVRTINYCKDKAAVQESGRSINIQPSVIDSMSKNINEVEDMPQDTEEHRKWKSVALKFRDHIKNYGKHASAMLVSPNDICQWSPVERQKGEFLVAYDFHQLEEQGLLKLDLLGLETIDIIHNTKFRAGVDIDVNDIPDDDPETVKMLAKGDVEGCFQIDSNVAKPIVMRMGVKNVEDISAVVALGRPGPLDSGMVETFLKRRNHQEPITYDIPELEPVLRNTEGVIVYQEQIMSVARTLCGYSLGEADNLRRIIGRKVIEEMKPAVDDMIQRGMANGYSREQMIKITDAIDKFAKYSFNMGHSIAYGKTAWATAYLKCHYPAAFMASVLDSKCKDKPKLATYVMYCKNNGIRILPPQIEHKRCYSGYDENGPYIILGLNCILNVGNVSLRGKQKDFYQFLVDNLTVNKKALVCLVKAGVFEGNRDEMIQYISYAKDKRKSKGDFEYIPTKYDNDSEQLDVLGVTFGDILSKYDTSIADNVKTFAYDILEVKLRKTKTGKNMAFVKVRNNSYVKDLVIFNNRYKDIKAHKVYIMEVKGSRIFDFFEANPLTNC